MELTAVTTAGPVVGRERRGVALFAGIPYAAPPLGELRWAAPQPPEPWAEPRDATAFGSAAPQLPGDGLTNAAPVIWDEDCLTLNVCTPGVDSERRPVFVWIHGGAYRHGTGATPWYDGTSFAKRGVVVVTINYRLGALGFCAVPGADAGGICGTLDQVAALGWVRDNIGAFGGDPSRVTIAGESAGAFSVATLTSMSATDGLFGQAIAQSGAGHHVLSANDAAAVADALLEELGAADLAAARSMDAMAVLEAQARVEARSHEFMHRLAQPFYPSVTAPLLPGHPIDLMAEGAGSDVAMLTGVNADETTLFGMGSTSDDRLERAMATYVDPSLPMIERYRAALPDASAGEIAVQISSDHMFAIPMVRMAEARAAHGADTWVYRFDWKSRAFGGSLGATHALEIPFTFNTLDRAGVDVFLGTTDLPVELAEIMHTAWVSFISTGVPETPGTGPWPTYRPDQRAVLEFAEKVQLLDDPAAALRSAWDGIR